MAEKKKNELKEKLFYKPGNGYDGLSAAEEKKMNAYCEGYKDFLNHGKTERLCVDYCIKLAKGKGFKEYKAGMKLKAGDKVYFNNRGKAIMLAVMGTEGLEKGINLTAAHTDAPRLDLKPNPLYEDAELAYLKTHHYGGIRKYQWLARTLELHGVVILKNGKSVEVNIGGDENDPQFIIEDLLPHLRKPSDEQVLDKAVPSEILNVLVGSRPIGDKEDSERVKMNILKILNEKYGLVEEDFISAELEVIPAVKARDVGFDRSLIAAYGHDDRVCADVTAAYDPNYAEVFEFRNDSKINHGVAFCKYTGHGGKGGASDASAEVVGKLRKLMNDNGVVWQMTQMGKNEQGGGGTVALDLANRNIDTIDAGVPVLAMHAPIETVAKFDCYMTYKCMKTVFEKA